MPTLEAIRLWSTTAASLFIAVMTGMTQLEPPPVAAPAALVLDAGAATPVLFLVQGAAR